MDDLSPESAASFLEEYARRLHGATSMKWTGEFGAIAGVEARLLRIAEALRQRGAGSESRLGEDDARFLRGQAESLRSPNRLTLHDPMVTAEWRLASESAFQTAEQLEAVAELIAQRSR